MRNFLSRFFIFCLLYSCSFSFAQEKIHKIQLSVIENSAENPDDILFVNYYISEEKLIVETTPKNPSDRQKKSWQNTPTQWKKLVQKINLKKFNNIRIKSPKKNIDALPFIYIETDKKQYLKHKSFTRDTAIWDDFQRLILNEFKNLK